MHGQTNLKNAGHIYTSREIKCDRYPVTFSLEIICFQWRYLLRNTTYVFQFGHSKILICPDGSETYFHL